MTIICPFCDATYRVNPDRISPSGVRTRCTQCAGVFGIRESGETVPLEAADPDGSASPAAITEDRASEQEGGEAAVSAAAASSEPPGPGGPPQDDDSTIAPDAWGESTTGAEAPGDAQAETGESPLATEPPGEEAAPSAESAPTTERPVFGRQDPDTRAHRIARALVSDIVAYHGDRLEGAREAGTLKSEFREEIVKSWEEYVEQVGEEFAKETPYFKNALNEILAQGNKVF